MKSLQTSAAERHPKHTGGNLEGKSVKQHSDLWIDLIRVRGRESWMNAGEERKARTRAKEATLDTTNGRGAEKKRSHKRQKGTALAFANSLKLRALPSFSYRVDPFAHRDAGDLEDYTVTGV